MASLTDSRGGRAADDIRYVDVIYRLPDGADFPPATWQADAFVRELQELAPTIAVLGVPNAGRGTRFYRIRVGVQSRDAAVETVIACAERAWRRAAAYAAALEDDRDGE